MLQGINEDQVHIIMIFKWSTLLNGVKLSSVVFYLSHSFYSKKDYCLEEAFTVLLKLLNI